MTDAVVEKRSVEDMEQPGVALKSRACSEERRNHGDRHCGSHKENEEKESDLHGCHNLHYL